jgi:hypothetical protein
MTIKQQGGIFGRNPTFNNVEVEGTLTIGGSPIPDPLDTLTTSDIGVTLQGYDAGLDSMATQANTSVNIAGGNIDGTTIGNSVKGAGSFTTVVATTAFKETNGNSSRANGATLVITVTSPRRPQFLTIYSTYNLNQGWFGLIKGDGGGNVQTNAIINNGGVTVAGTSGNQVTITNTYGGTANIYWSLMPLGAAV